MQPPSFCSYSWGLLFKLRSVFFPLMQHQVGDGQPTSFGTIIGVV